MDFVKEVMIFSIAVGVITVLIATFIQCCLWLPFQIRQRLRLEKLKKNWITIIVDLKCPFIVFTKWYTYTDGE